jgi:hypothetical protein
MKSCVLSLVAVLLLGGCATKNEEALEKNILTPTTVEIYDVSVKNVWPEDNNGRKLLREFPFVCNKPIIDFKGRFSEQFYDKINYKYKASALKDIDFWKLREDPFSEDFIYVVPERANQFKRVSNDLLENIAYSNNLSSKDQEILKWWISQGGILWIDGGMYSTKYDMFKKNGEIDSKAINKKMIEKSSDLRFMDREVRTFIYESKKIDTINYEPLEINYQTKSSVPYFQDIKNLQIVTNNYLSADFIPNGDYLLESTDGKPLVSFVKYGKGGVVFLRPFEFENKMYDGELLRWKLLNYLMQKMYLKSNNNTSSKS